jgi:protein TonB
VALLDRLDTTDIVFDGSKPVGDIPPDPTIGPSKSVGDIPPEPTLATTPLVIEFDEPARLDPKRTALAWLIPSPVRQKMLMRWSLGALALHLLPVLMIVSWPVTTDEVPVIPVQLVIVEPPPEPENAPAPAQPTPGRLASDDFGDVTPKEQGTTTSPEPPSASEPAPARDETQPPESETPPPPKPTPTETQTAALPAPVPPPKPTPPQPHPPKPTAVSLQPQPQPPHEAPRAAQFAGPTATRDEYLAYLVKLTRQHIDQLPVSVIGSRHGEAVVSVDVLDDGTIEHVSIEHSSGYPDIDERIERMVTAVGKFPPVPQWFQGRTMELQFTLHFPEALKPE